MKRVNKAPNSDIPKKPHFYSSRDIRREDLKATDPDDERERHIEKPRLIGLPVKLKEFAIEAEAFKRLGLALEDSFFSENELRGDEEPPEGQS